MSNKKTYISGGTSDNFKFRSFSGFVSPATAEKEAHKMGLNKYKVERVNFDTSGKGRTIRTIEYFGS
jgi:hypothetical protein